MSRIRRRYAAASFAAALALASVCQAEDVALTFDDLPLNGTLAPGTTRAQIVEDVLAILKAHRVPTVYGFVNAQRFEGSADGAAALKKWVAGGERVGNHTYTHVDLSQVTAERFLQDVLYNEPVLELLAPDDSWHWLRYPFLREGDSREKRRAVRAGLTARGYRIAQVTLDYEDYLWNSPYARCLGKGDTSAIAALRSSYLAIAAAYIESDRQMASAVFGRPISHVLLLHLGAFSSAILPDVLDLLERKGFHPTTLEEAQKDPAYQSDPDAGNRNGGTLLEQWLDARHLQYPPAPMKPYRELDGLCR